MTVLETGVGTDSTTFPRFGEVPISVLQTLRLDIAPSFFGPAQTLLEEWSDLIISTSLDIERDPLRQGFDVGSYCLIIAPNFLHSTSILRTH